MDGGTVLFAAPAALCILAVTVLVFCRSAQAATIYSVVRINGMGTEMLAYGGSPDHKQVAGQYRFSGSPLTFHGFVFSQAVMKDIGAAAGFLHSAGRDINDGGTEVGLVSNSTSFSSGRGFVLSGGVFQVLPIFDGSGFTFANGINNAGKIVGISDSRPFQWSIGDAALSQLPSPAGSDGTGGAWSIDTVGNIVGWANVSGQHQPVLWSGGVASLLPLPATAVSGEATRIADDGRMIGSATYSFGHTRATLYSGGPVIDMGTLGGPSSEAYDMNASGQIVGYSMNSTTDFPGHAFIDQQGVMTDLNTLLQSPGTNGVTLNRAYSISDAGQIVAVGASSWYVLTPVPEPAAAVTAVYLCAALATHRRSRRLLRRSLTPEPDGYA